ncbi:hypothetical protein ACFQ88_05965 [Paenibacillus sp. NPDC056579]|uniref:hypothetical protein n=1 Tax=Paenibacillus sp. NPDC056579 TaxID=3345871 RepID=UPI0036ABFC3C
MTTFFACVSLFRFCLKRLHVEAGQLPDIVLSDRRHILQEGEEHSNTQGMGLLHPQPSLGLCGQ